MSSFFLKVFALIFMIIDHVGYLIFPDKIIFRIIGRLAMPLFAYQMAVGFSHTRNKKKHILKLLLFAIICQVPYNLLAGPNTVPNIIFTFVIALLIIFVLENIKPFEFNNETKKVQNFNLLNLLISTCITIFLFWLVIYIKSDYSWYAVALTVMFYFTLNKKILSILLFFVLACIYSYLYIYTNNTMQLLAVFSLFDIFFICLFNGKKGYKFSWVFYALYAFHFIPIVIINNLIK